MLRKLDPVGLILGLGILIGILSFAFGLETVSRRYGVHVAGEIALLVGVSAFKLAHVMAERIKRGRGI